MSLTAAALTLPAMGLLFVPVLIAVPWLYPWAAAGEHRRAARRSISRPGSSSSAPSLFRGLDRARVVGARRLGRYRADDAGRLRRLDRLRAHRLASPASTGSNC